MRKENNEREITSTRPTPHVSWALLRPGFWRCRRTIQRFKRFQYLVIHHERWSSHINYAPPVETLIDKKWAKQDPITEIEHQMHRLVMPIMRDMELANVPHTVMVERRDSTKRRRSLIADFLVFPDDWHQAKFEILMQRLEIAIGQYEERKRRADPLFWTACIV